MASMEDNLSERKERKNKVLHSQSKETVYSEYKYIKED